MARGRSRQTVVQVVKRKVRSSPRARRGFKFGGDLLGKVERGLGKGILYGGAASKFVPTLAPIATLYGEYAGGGLEGLAINEFLVKPFLGIPSTLPNILGNLGGLFGQGGQPGQVQNPMMGVV